MPKYQLIIDHPDRYFQTDDIYTQGSSPGGLAALLQLVQEKSAQLSEIQLCLTHFNNEALHEQLLQLSQQGVVVNLFTRPITALSEMPIDALKDLVTGKVVGNANLFAQSAYALARPIFAAHYKTTYPNFKIHFFPHLNIQSNEGNPFQKGQQPYSLEVNVILLLYSSGGGTVVFTTADFSIGQPVIESLYLSVEEDWELLKTTHRFFQQLQRNAVPLKHFDFKRKYNDLILRMEEVAQSNSVYFTAPFLKDSTAAAEMKIVQLIQSAQQRIWVHSPELTAYEYLVNGRFHEDLENEDIEHFGFLRTALEKASEGVELKCLAKAWKQKEAQTFVEMSQHTNNVSLRMYHDVTCSFILVDDTLLLCSGGFDGESFIYLNDVQIEKFTEAPDVNFTGAFAKMRQYLQIRDGTLIAQMESLFKRKWDVGKDVQF